jgi:hypothetical protein
MSVYPDGSALVAYAACGCVQAALLVDDFPPDDIAKEMKTWRNAGLRVRCETAPLPEIRLGVCSSGEHPQPRGWVKPNAPQKPVTAAATPPTTRLAEGRFGHA